MMWRPPDERKEPSQQEDAPRPRTLGLMRHRGRDEANPGERLGIRLKSATPVTVGAYRDPSFLPVGLTLGRRTHVTPLGLEYGFLPD